MIVLTHKIDGKDVEYVAVNEAQAATLKKSGWKRKSTTPTKAVAAEKEK